MRPYSQAKPVHGPCMGHCFHPSFTQVRLNLNKTVYNIYFFVYIYNMYPVYATMYIYIYTLS